MEGIEAILSIVIGFLVRFGFPILITILAVYVLRRLDNRWIAEAEEEGLIKVAAKNPGCWNAKNCSAEKRAKCPAFKNQDVPCWQLFREEDGRMQENCLGCDVFIKAPVPVAS